MGRKDEFSEYVAARWPRFVRSAVLFGCSPGEAEDVVQTALMRCLVHWSKVDRAHDRDAYVHRILFNTFTSARRRRWTREHITPRMPEMPAPDHPVAIDTADAVLRSLDLLSRDHRTVVVLRYYAHLSEQQMAAVLGVAAGTVKSRLSRAFKVLAEDPLLAEQRGTP